MSTMTANGGQAQPAAPEHPSASGRGFAVVIAAPIVVGLVFIWRSSFVLQGARRFTLFDDAMVSMTYARNVADGHGFTWIDGSSVEGFTNPLWTVVMAAAHKVAPAQPALAVMFASLALVVGVAVLAHRIARQLDPTSRRAPVAAGLLAGCSFPLLFWSLRGMEVGFFAFLLLAAVTLALDLAERCTARRLALLSACLGAGLLTRLDFAVPAAVLIVWLWFVVPPPARVRVVATAGTAAALTLLLLLVWQQRTFGTALPNTYYLKMEGEPLWRRVRRGIGALVFTSFVSCLPYAAPALASFGSQVRLRSRALLLVAVALSLGAYSAYVGGDAWESASFANRYVTPAVLLLGILAASGIEPLLARLGTRQDSFFWTVSLITLTAIGPSLFIAANDALGSARGVIELNDPSGFIAIVSGVVVVLVAGTLLRILVRDRPAIDPRGRVVAAGLWFAAALFATSFYPAVQWWEVGGPHVIDDQHTLALGLEVAAITTPDARVAVVWAGSVPYYSNRSSIDLLGKTDPVVAHLPAHTDGPYRPGHDKWDYTYSVGQLRPDLVAQIPLVDTADVDYVVAQGYVWVEPIPAARIDTAAQAPLVHYLARKDSTAIRWDLVRPVGG